MPQKTFKAKYMMKNLISYKIDTFFHSMLGSVIIQRILNAMYLAQEYVLEMFQGNARISLYCYLIDS